MNSSGDLGPRPLQLRAGSSTGPPPPAPNLVGERPEGGLIFPDARLRRETFWTICVWTYGRAEIQFSMLMKHPPFDAELQRRELLRRLNTVPGVSLPADAIARRPSILLSLLTAETTMTAFLSALDWMVAEIRDQSSLGTRTDATP